MSAADPGPASFAWMLDDLVRRIPGARLALGVSSDGLLMGLSSGVDRTPGDQLAAIVVGLSSLSRGAARELGSRVVYQSVVEFDAGFLALMTISDGSVLAVAADATADIGSVGYEMGALVGRAESLLTPGFVHASREALPVDPPVAAGER